jgi:hypothetical protein
MTERVRHVQAQNVKVGMRIRRDGEIDPVTKVTRESKVTGVDDYLAPNIGKRILVTADGKTQSTTPGYLYVVVEEE